MPSIEAAASTRSTAPGLGESVDYLRSMAFLEVDYREPKNARKGGWYRVDFSRLRRSDHAAATRSTASTPTSGSSSDSSPGGASSRRGCSCRRRTPTTGHVMPFYLDADARRKRHAARIPRVPVPRTARDSGQAEYRWEIWSGLDGALFYDAGKVADRRADLNFKDLETRLRLRVPLQHRRRRSSFAWMPASGVAMANISISSLAASSKRVRGAPAGRRAGRRRWRRGRIGRLVRRAAFLPRRSALVGRRPRVRRLEGRGDRGHATATTSS